MGKFEEPSANQWVQPRRKGYKMACCDCGLVHDMDFRVYAGHPQFRVTRRNERSTGQIRRWLKNKESPVKFIVFAYGDYYPSGGCYDSIGVFGNLEEATKEAIKQGSGEYGNWHILETPALIVHTEEESVPLADYTISARLKTWAAKHRTEHPEMWPAPA